MVLALGTPKRHPESGIFFLRKRVPDRLREVVGKCEIKISLRTRDANEARIRNLEELLRIERQWAQFDGSIVDAEGNLVGRFEIKAGPGQSSQSIDQSANESFKRERRDPTIVAPGRPAIRLSGLFGSYAKEAELAPATIKRWSPVIDRFAAHLGHEDPRDIAPERRRLEGFVAARGDLERHGPRRLPRRRQGDLAIRPGSGRARRKPGRRREGSRSRTRGWRTATGPIPVITSRSGR
jgi:hypothetical protein